MNRDREQSLSGLIARVNHHLEGSLAALLKKEGLSVEHFRILEALGSEDGRAMSDLSAIAMVDPPTMTKMVDKLVANGLVYRAPDLKDRRKVRIFISERGRQLHKVAEAPAEALQNRLVRGLGESEKTELSRLLNMLLD